MMKTCSIFSPSFLLITSFSLSSLSPSKLLHQGSALCSSRMTFGNEKAGSWMTWKSFVPLSWEHKQRGHTGTAATLPSCAFLSAEILRCHCTSRPVIQTAGNLYFFRYLLNFLDFIWSLRSYCCLKIDYGWDDSEATIANSLDVSYWFAANIRWHIFACWRPKTSVPVWSLRMNHCPVSKRTSSFWSTPHLPTFPSLYLDKIFS